MPINDDHNLTNIKMQFRPSMAFISSIQFYAGHIYLQSMVYQAANGSERYKQKRKKFYYDIKILKMSIATW